MILPPSELMTPISSNTIVWEKDTHSLRAENPFPLSGYYYDRHTDTIFVCIRSVRTGVKAVYGVKLDNLYPNNIEMCQFIYVGYDLTIPLWFIDYGYRIYDFLYSNNILISPQAGKSRRNI